MLESFVWCLWPQTADTCFRGAQYFLPLSFVSKEWALYPDPGRGIAGLQLIGKQWRGRRFGASAGSQLVPPGHWLLYDSLVGRRKHGALLMPFRWEFSEEICFCLASSRCSERSQAVGILRMYEFRFLAVRLCPCGSKEVISQPLFVEADKWHRTTSSGASWEAPQCRHRWGSFSLTSGSIFRYRIPFWRSRHMTCSAWNSAGVVSVKPRFSVYSPAAASYFFDSTLESTLNICYRKTIYD